MKCLARIVFLLFLVQSTQTWALPTPTFRTVALTGQQAPGTPAGVRFATTFSLPSINNAGQVAFRSSLQLNPGVVTTANDSGIWSEGSGPLGMLAREGDPAPGPVPLSTYGPLSSGEVPLIADSGDVTWRGNVMVPQPGGGASTRTAIWAGNSGTLAPVAVSGDLAPMLPSGTLHSSLGIPAINSSGAVVFNSFVTGGGLQPQTQALWIHGTSGLTLVGLSGSQAPGTPPGTGFVLFGDPRINAAGEIAFGATSFMQGSSQNRQGVWKGTPGSLELVAHAGGQAPGLPAGALFNGNSMSVGFNSSGQVAFQAGLAESVSAGVDQSNNAGIWSEGSGTLELIARRGTQPPGMPAGGMFQTFGVPLLSDSGHTAFLARAELSTTGPTPLGIWSNASGALELVAAEEMPAPGVSNGTFTNFFGRGFMGLAVNGAGHLAFAASVEGSGITASNNGGLWAQDSTGTLRLLVRDGDLFEVAPGDQRVVSSISLMTNSGGGDGQGRSFSDDYKIAFHLFFTDGTTGLFVTQVAVPEPGAAVLAVLGVVARVSLNRKRRGEIGM